MHSNRPLSHPLTRRTRRASLALAAAATALLVSACGGDGDGDATEPGATDLAGAQVDSGVPEACLEAFPVAMTAPDLADVSLLPADWPAAPAGATLCQTSSTADGAYQTADYATEDDPAAVLDAWEAALADFSPTRGDEGAGEQLTGTAGTVAFEITTRDGAFSVVLARS